MDTELRAGALTKSPSATRVAAIGVGMYLVAALLMALNGAFIKMAMQAGLTPGRVTELRNAGALVLLFCYVLLSNRSALRLRRGEWRLLAVYGVVAFALVQFLYFATISRLAIGIGTMLAFLAPVVVALWTRLDANGP